MSQINLSIEHMRQIKTILRQNAPELEVWAYGSRVNGNAHNTSDLDLVLRNPQDLQKPIKNISHIKQLFIDSNLPFLVDLMDWACLPESYREEINKLHVII